MLNVMLISMTDKTMICLSSLRIISLEMEISVKNMNLNTDIVIVGCGVAGLFCAINLPADKKVTIITKSEIDKSDSFLAQGGICMLKNDNDYESYYNDTMKAGHYENSPKAVETMIRSSKDIISDLISYGVEFEHQNNELLFTREGAHSVNRILFYKDITGKEITRKLINKVSTLKNVTLIPNTSMVDIIENDNECHGIICRNEENEFFTITAPKTVLATGGIGGLYDNSTNFSHLTGDSLAIAINHNIDVKDIHYIQIHPTTLYSNKPGRRFLISESVRGEGAHLLDKNHNRFVDELLPRDVVSEAIYKKMNEDNTPYVWLDMTCIDKDVILNHFPNIYKHCLAEGYDVTKEYFPVVPAQHYFMGGINVDLDGCTSMKSLYAIGETCCNGVHGANRLASNSLLESLVWAKSCAKHIINNFSFSKPSISYTIDFSKYKDIKKLSKDYANIILNEIKKSKENNYNEH